MYLFYDSRPEALYYGDTASVESSYFRSFYSPMLIRNLVVRFVFLNSTMFNIRLVSESPYSDAL